MNATEARKISLKAESESTVILEEYVKLIDGKIEEVALSGLFSFNLTEFIGSLFIKKPNDKMMNNIINYYKSEGYSVNTYITFSGYRNIISWYR